MTSALVDLRNAVRPFLENLTAGDCALVAVSGGADSLALAYALIKEAPDLAITLIGVTVDHQLQSGSADQAKKVQAVLKEMGYQEVLIEKVTVEEKSGLEADARTARYAALDSVAHAFGATQIFLGHTRDDQAETVLLGLARGSGNRSLNGMAELNGRFLRPLLAISRETTVAFCEDSGLAAWIDPQNSDQKFTRVRVRKNVMQILEAELGPGVADALSRTAEQLREDETALAELAEHYYNEFVKARSTWLEIEIDDFAAMPLAIRHRVIALALGVLKAPEFARAPLCFA